MTEMRQAARTQGEPGTAAHCTNVHGESWCPSGSSRDWPRDGVQFYPESLSPSQVMLIIMRDTVCPQECLSLFIAKPCLDTREPLINLLNQWTPPGSHYLGTHSLWGMPLLTSLPFCSLTPIQPSEGSSHVAQCFQKVLRLCSGSQRTGLYLKHCSL